MPLITQPPRHRLSMVLSRGRTVVTDTAVHDMPECRVDCRHCLGIGQPRRRRLRAALSDPRLSSFGHPEGQRSKRIQEAVKILDKCRVNFECEGQMATDVVFNHRLMQQQYPFCRLTGPVSVVIMPAFHWVSISTRCCRNSTAPPPSARCWSQQAGADRRTDAKALRYPQRWRRSDGYRAEPSRGSHAYSVSLLIK